MYLLNEDGSATVWDRQNQQWIKIYSLSTNVSKYLPRQTFLEIEKHFEKNCWKDKARGNE